MKTSNASRDARPTNSPKQGEALSSFFPFVVPSRRWRVATSFSLGISLVLLILTVPDACAQPFTERNPAQDFNTLGLVGDNKNPVGLCAVKHPTNGKTYMLVSDIRDGKIYTYDMEGKERQDNHRGTAANKDDFDLAPEEEKEEEKVNLPTGIWASGTNLWVANSGEDRIFAYDLRTGDHDAEKGFDLGEGNTYAQGIWSDGETMWVSDFAGKDAADEKKIFISFG